MKKGFICLVMAILLCLTAIPALAAGEEVRYSTDGGASWKSDSLMNALWNTYGQKNVKIELLRDITLDSSWYAQQDLVYGSDVTFELDGKGYTIHRGGCSTMLFCMRGEGSVATLKDVTIDGGAKWSSDDPATRENTGTVAGDANAHIIYVDSGATLILESGVILQNNDLGSRTYGAAVVVGYSDSGYGKMIMKDGAIIRNNRAESGGGVCVMHSNDAFEMQGGEISGNYAVSGGGGVYTEGNFTMKNGEITNNASGNNGGGVCVNGVFTVEDGEISGNKSAAGGGITALNGSVILKGGEVSGNSITGSMGGGVLVHGGSLTVSGDPVVTGNDSSGSDNNVYLSSGKTIKIDGSLDSSARIGITTRNLPTENAPVSITGENNSNFMDRFISDNPHFWEINSSSDVVQLSYATVYTVSCPDDATGSVSANPSSAAAGKTIRLVATPMLGYVLADLKAEDESGNPIELVDNCFTMPAGNVIVTAEFVPAPAPDAEIPDTGDGFNAVLCVSAMLISAAMMALIFKKRYN